MVLGRTAKFNPLQSVDHGLISATYVAFPNPFPLPIRGFRVINNTDGDMFLAITNGSTPPSDGTADNSFAPASSFYLWDISSNAPPGAAFDLAQGQVVWVRQSSAPTKNSIYLETLSSVQG